MYCCGICFSLKVVNTMFFLNIASNYCYCLITIAKHRAKAIKPCYILHSPELPLFSIENSFPNSISMCFKMTYAPCHEQANRSRAMQGSSSDEFICSRSIKIKQQPTPRKTQQLILKIKGFCLTHTKGKITVKIHPTKKTKNAFTLEEVVLHLIHWFGLKSHLCIQRALYAAVTPRTSSSLALDEGLAAFFSPEAKSWIGGTVDRRGGGTWGQAFVPA